MTHSHRPLPLIAGNWKMNGLRTSLREIDLIKEADASYAACDILICPPATLLYEAANRVKDTKGSLQIGAQDCHTQTHGAYTGDLSAQMLADAGATFIIVGHSERRAYHNETNETVAAKATATQKAGLTPIICVGETEEEYKKGETNAKIQRQIQDSIPKNCDSANLVIAYEPIWAIGTGLVPTEQDIAQTHQTIRGELAKLFSETESTKIRILYGGSVNPKNAGKIMIIDNVDGVLVGGASLLASDFLQIIASAPK